MRKVILFIASMIALTLSSCTTEFEIPAVLRCEDGNTYLVLNEDKTAVVYFDANAKLMEKVSNGGLLSIFSMFTYAGLDYDQQTHLYVLGKGSWQKETEKGIGDYISLTYHDDRESASKSVVIVCNSMHKYRDLYDAKAQVNSEAVVRIDSLPVVDEVL